MDTPQRWARAAAQLSFYGLMAAGVWMLWSASFTYLEYGTHHPFILEKLPLSHPDVFRAALYVHVPSALLALPACLVLSLPGLRHRFPRAHRWLGRISGALVVLAVTPSGLYLAFFAHGGLVTTAGFWLTGGIAAYAMLRSVASARAGRVQEHRRYSMHVTAQLSVAVFSRFMLVGFESAGLYATWAYVAALWIPVALGALVVEWSHGPRRPSRMKGLPHEKAAPAAHVDALH